jgi:transposase-like protein
LVHVVIQEFLEAEMAEAVGAEKGERAEGRFCVRQVQQKRRSGKSWEKGKACS